MYILAIDLGGTRIKLGIMDDSGSFRCKDECLTLPGEGPLACINRMKALADPLLEQLGIQWSEIAGIAAGVPGLLDIQQGKILFAAHLRWNDVPMVQMMEQVFGLPVLIENDANAAIYGEYSCGSAQGAGCVAGLTLGTGVGGGIISRGRILRGGLDSGPDFGHITIDPKGPRCDCGNYGCLAMYSSATGIHHYLEQHQDQCRKSLIWKLSEERGLPPSPREVALAAEAQDPFALEVIERAARGLGIITANLVWILNPDSIIFCGGITRAGKILLDPILKEARKRTNPAIFDKTQVVFGMIGDHAGLIGIGMLGKKHFVSA